MKSRFNMKILLHNTFATYVKMKNQHLYFSEIGFFSTESK